MSIPMRTAVRPLYGKGQMFDAFMAGQYRVSRNWNMDRARRAKKANGSMKMRNTWVAEARFDHKQYMYHLRRARGDF